MKYKELIQLLDEVLTTHRFIGEVHPVYNVKKFEEIEKIGIFSHRTNGFDFSKKWN